VGAEGFAGLVSDYRYRGISLSDGQPAAQGGIELTAGTWFAGSWASTTRGEGDSGAEVDLYGGRRGTIGSFRYALTGYYYVDTRRSVVDYAELQAFVGRPVRGVELNFEASLAPPQAHFDKADPYVAAGLSLPIKRRGVSLSARAGYEGGGWHKADWDLGADYHHAALHIGAHLIGTAGCGCRAARPTLVGSAEINL
jgi:uncharacterized protein (TIGR02001 family)